MAGVADSAATAGTARADKRGSAAAGNGIAPISKLQGQWSVVRSTQWDTVRLSYGFIGYEGPVSPVQRGAHAGSGSLGDSRGGWGGATAQPFWRSPAFLPPGDEGGAR